MRSASQIQKASIAVIVLILVSNIMIHVAVAKGKEKYQNEFDVSNPLMPLLVSYGMILFYGMSYSLAKQGRMVQEGDVKILQAAAGGGVINSIVILMSFGFSSKTYSKTPEGQMVLGALSIQLVAVLGYAGYFFSQ